VSVSRDPDRLVEEWRDTSRRAAMATGYRTQPRAVARSSAVRSVGALAVVVLVVVGGLVIRGTSPTPGPGGPVVGTAEDSNFRLVLTTPRSTYTTNDAIEPVATVTYLGPNATETMFHAMYPVGFQIEEVGGVRNMGGGMEQPCKSTELARGGSDALPFGKAGSPDDPTAGFDIDWYQDPVLRLPIGTWRIIAHLDIQLGKCGGDPHQLTVENVVRVVAGYNVSPSPSPTSSPPSDTPRPSPSLSIDAATALEIARKYEDGLTTGHFDGVWPMLSPWSRTTIGSYATFADAEAREIAMLGAAVNIASPSRDPSLLDPAFLGARATDLAATADPSRTYVVSIRHPTVDGASAATTNLVVAPLMTGRNPWRIWIDASPGLYGAWSFPDGCAAFGLSGRRCEAVVNTAATNAAFDRSIATSISLMPEPGCGGDPLSDVAGGFCIRSMAFVAGVRFERADGTSVLSEVYCGVGPPTLTCSETPGIQALDLHGAGYWDVPCAGEAPDACATPIPKPTGVAAAAGRELKIDAIAVLVGSVGHREVEIGRAILADGIVQEARFSVADQTQVGFLLDPGLVRMELRSTVPGRPPFDNAYNRGSFKGPEEVRVVLVFDVSETGQDAVIHVTDVLVR
jgi:hypothetical protein